MGVSAVVGGVVGLAASGGDPVAGIIGAATGGLGGSLFGGAGGALAGDAAGAAVGSAADSFLPSIFSDAVAGAGAAAPAAVGAGSSFFGDALSAFAPSAASGGLSALDALYPAEMFPSAASFSIPETAVGSNVAPFISDAWTGAATSSLPVQTPGLLDTITSNPLYQTAKQGMQVYNTANSVMNALNPQQPQQKQMGGGTYQAPSTVSGLSSLGGGPVSPSFGDPFGASRNLRMR